MPARRASAGDRKATWLPGEGHLALIRREHAGDDLDERALARAVRAHERMRLRPRALPGRPSGAPSPLRRSSRRRECEEAAERRSWLLRPKKCRRLAPPASQSAIQPRSGAFARDQLLRRVVRVGRHRGDAENGSSFGLYAALSSAHAVVVVPDCRRDLDQVRMFLLRQDVEREAQGQRRRPPAGC